jgi:methyl-accepting chemotaxis protein WspA
MRLRSILPDTSSIAGRLVASFLLISLVPCVVVLSLTMSFSRRSLETTVRQRLTVICDNKASLLEDYASERRSDLLIISSASTITEPVAILSRLVKDGKRDSDEFRAEVERLGPRMRGYIEATSSYENVYLFDIDGVPLAAHRPGLDAGANLETGPLGKSEMADAFRRARTLLQPIVSDFQVYPGHSSGLGFVAGPLIKDGVAVGVIMLELDNASVVRTFGTYFGLGETGDVTAATLEGDGLTYVAPTRFDASVAFRDHIRFGDARGYDMQMAVRGERGFGEMLDHTGKWVVTAWTYVPAFRWGITVKQDVDEAFELLRKQRTAVAVLMAVAGVVVWLVARSIARSISGPIREAAQVATRVAAGDLTARVTAHASGEAGQLLGAVEAMTLDLRTLIGRIQQSSIALMSTATEISATSRQQGEAVSDYGASTSQAAAAVKEISATSLELLKTINEVNDVASKTATMAAEGQGSLAEMGRSMRQLAESTSSIGSKLSVISERAAHINLAVTTIAKVADQTNLLSINAAIEAEKAGESGLGFLVVAREIRRLADQTAVATLDIERMVKEMQYSVSAGVMEMDKFSDQVRRGVDEVASIGEQLGGIIHAVQSLTGRFDQVVEGMRVQSQGAEQIREAVIRLSEGAHQTSISLREFNKATDHLREAVGGLKEEVSRFTVDTVPLTLPRG